MTELMNACRLAGGFMSKVFTVLTHLGIQFPNMVCLFFLSYVEHIFHPARSLFIMKQIPGYIK